VYFKLEYAHNVQRISTFMRESAALVMLVAKRVKIVHFVLAANKVILTVLT